MRDSRKIIGLALAGSLLAGGAVLAKAPIANTSPAQVRLAAEGNETFLDKLEKSKKHLEGLHQMFDEDKTEHKEIRARTFKAIDETMKALDEEIAAFKKDHPNVK